MHASYSIDDISRAHEIFAILATSPTHELRRTNNPDLYNDYVERDDIRELCAQEAATWNCTIVAMQSRFDMPGERDADGLCLVPDKLNTTLGYTRATLRDAVLPGTGNTMTDYYLIVFIIMTLIEMFYDGSGENPRTRSSITMRVLQTEVERQLKIGTEHEEERDGILYTDLYNRFTALRSDDDDTKKTTKQGFMHYTLSFLDKQGLVNYAKDVRVFSPTAKMDAIMERIVLTDDYFERFSRFFDVDDGEIEDFGFDDDAAQAPAAGKDSDDAQNL